MLKNILTRPETYRVPNWIDQAKATMDGDDYDYLVECLNDSTFSNAYLANKLTEAGYPVSRTTIANIRQRKLHG
jgi:hypothetical protein